MADPAWEPALDSARAVTAATVPAVDSARAVKAAMGSAAAMVLVLATGSAQALAVLELGPAEVTAVAAMA